MCINLYTECNTCKEPKHIVDSVGTFNVFMIDQIIYELNEA